MPELFNLLIELSAAESNIAQALRQHVAFVEDILHSRNEDRRVLWLPSLTAGETVGNAWTETGAGKVTGFAIRVAPDVGGALRRNGAEYYETCARMRLSIDNGCLFRRQSRQTNSGC